MCLAYSALREAQTVVVVEANKQDRALPPFEFITDRDRLLGLVYEPLCPPAADARPLQLPVPAVARCEVRDGAVEVRLRPGVQWQGQPLDASQTKVLLEAHEARRTTGMDGATSTWAEVRVLDASTMRVQPLPGASAQALRFVLADLLLGALHSDCRIGTGPWVERDCAVDMAIKKKLLPAALRDSKYVTDVAVLDSGDWPFRRRRVLVVGWDAAQDPDGLAAPLATALKADNGQRVHLLRGLESAEIQSLRVALAGDKPAWSLVSRMGERNVWLVARPGLPRAERLRLLNAAREVLRDPAYFDELSGAPARSLLPEVYPPLVFAGRAPAVAPAECTETATGAAPSDTGAQVLLTHSRWGALAQRLFDFKNGDLQLQVKDVVEESKLRRSGAYALSINSPVALDSSHPARIFTDNLTAWFTADHPLVKMAEQAAALELADPAVASATLVQLLRCLDAYMLPISSPPSWVVAHDDLRGWNAAADWLDPAEVGLRSDAYRWVDVLGLGLLVMSAAVYALLRRQALERSRNLAEIASFHHDLSSPLASIRAEAENLREELAQAVAEPLGNQLRGCAEFIDHQTNYVIDLVDNLRAVNDPWGFISIENRSCSSLNEALAREQVALERRARLEDVQLRWTASLPADLEVVLPAATLRRVLRNLLDNAFKYRGVATFVTIRISASTVEGFICLQIEDDGIGFEDLPEAQIFVPRQRGRTARERQLPGQGLGLSSTYRLLAAAGATIEVTHRHAPTRLQLRLPRAPRSNHS
jgi:signal transduction histidine kinase